MLYHSPNPSDDARDRQPDEAAGSTRVGDHDGGAAIAIDQEVTETEAVKIAENVAEAAASRRVRPVEALLLVMLAISLLIHALTITRLFSVRNTLRDEIGQLAQSVRSAKDDTLRYTLPIDQQIPIDLDVPIKRSLVIPIRTEVRIQQEIQLPVQTAFGNLNIPIPIDTTVPISTSVPIDFDQTVNISTTVPLKLNVPIQIDLGSSEFSGYLDRLQKALLDLRNKL